MIKHSNSVRKTRSARRRVRTRPMAFASLAVLAALSSQAARAQTVDYGALEQLFGEAVTTSATGSPELYPTCL